MPLQIAERLDVLLIAAHNHRQAGLIVGIRERDLLLALVVDRHTADDHVDVLRLQGRNQTVEADVLDLCLAAHLLGNGTDEIHIKALIVLLSLILELKRGKVNRCADAELAYLLRLIAACAASEQGKAHECTRQHECQFLQLHGKPPQKIKDTQINPAALFPIRWAVLSVIPKNKGGRRTVCAAIPP